MPDASEENTREPENDEHLQWADNLGKILFQRRRGNWLAVLMALWSIAIAIAVAVYWDLIPIAGFILGAGLAGAFTVSRLRRCRFECRERGVRDVGVFGEKQIPYEELESFTFAAKEKFINDVYQGAKMNLVFVREKEPGGETIKFTELVRGWDKELDMLRDRIAGIMGSRMMKIFSGGHDVRWTRNLRFVAEGVECTPAGIIGKKEPFVVPFKDIAQLSIDKRVFYLRGGPNKKVLITEMVSQANFFPGYYMLNKIRPQPEWEIKLS